MTTLAFAGGIDDLADVSLPPNLKMAESYSTASIDYWRKFFKCVDADILTVIKYAILIASADCAAEFLSCRDQITEMLYNCWPMQCSSQRTERRTPEGSVKDDGNREDNHKRISCEDNEVTTSNEQTSSYTPDCSDFDEFEALTNVIEEEQQTVDEVLRIKGLLTNWKGESEKVLSDSLRRLQLMELSVETLSATDIGSAVSSLEKHKSRPIRLLAQTLVKGWKLLTEDWVTATTVSQEPSPVFIEQSPAEEEFLVPSELDFPPLDVGALLAAQTATFEFSEFFEGMDEDGNITCIGELNKNRRKSPQSISVRQDIVDARKPEVPRVPKPTDATRRASKPKDFPHPPVPERISPKATSYVPETPSPKATNCRNIQKRQNTRDQFKDVRGEEVVSMVSKPKDASNTPKPQKIERAQVTIRPSSTDAVPRNIYATFKTSESGDIVRSPLPEKLPSNNAHRNIQQRQRSSGVPLKPGFSRTYVSNKSEELAYRDKLEVAKRKLHDRYEEAKDAKRQRTVQVMELKDLPKLGLDKQQPNLTRGSCANRWANRKSR